MHQKQRRSEQVNFSVTPEVYEALREASKDLKYKGFVVRVVCDIIERWYEKWRLRGNGAGRKPVNHRRKNDGQRT
jgi:hypothetical protein